jgi:hypothetical protein
MTRAAAPRADLDAEATVTLRFAVFHDAPDLLRLAQLDSAEPLSEPILVAQVAGRLTAALSLSEDRVIADPFVLSVGAVELLRARGRQLSGPERPRRGWPRRRAVAASVALPAEVMQVRAAEQPSDDTRPVRPSVRP